MVLSNTDISRITNLTISHYESNPVGFWEGTKDHDVSQNYNALLSNIQGKAPYNILDFGCGPGRDLHYFKSIGHTPTGLDGCEAFCTMAREYAVCDVLHQNFMNVDLPQENFHGIFANASLFHIPKNIFQDVLKKFHDALKPGGILFSSNPRGHG